MNRRELSYMVLALAGAAVYILFAGAHGVVGFALDDAWIHQVYARNLASHGEFAFFTSQLSSGSTSPLWTGLLSIGYLVRMDFRAWAFLLGAVFLGASAIAVSRLVARLAPAIPAESSRIPMLVGLFLVLEWHLAWSAVSGMEILLFIFLSLFLLERFFAYERVWVLGLIAGLVTLTRPEGVALASLVGLGIAWRQVALPRNAASAIRNGARALLPVLWYALGFAIFIAPYLMFNIAVSGTALPNTFYAKNVEYSSLFDQSPFVLRWVQLLAVPWVGAQLLLLPGFIFVVAKLAARRQWLALIPAAWVVVLPALYALRLPVAYQHGRYEMPVIPFIGLYGIWGTAVLFGHIRSRIARMTWGLAVAVLVLVFWYLGAVQYGTDVAIIDCEMVQTAKWVATNAPPGALVAAHDIGAMGYIYDRPLVDLAGLVSPEVIPFIRNQDRLRDFLLAQHVTYAIFFPDWYPTLAANSHFVPVHQQNCPVARDAGGTDMVIYGLVQ